MRLQWDWTVTTIDGAEVKLAAHQTVTVELLEGVATLRDVTGDALGEISEDQQDQLDAVCGEINY